MPPCQPPRLSLRLAALFIAPLVGLALVAPALALQPETANGSLYGSDSSTSAATSRGASSLGTATDVSRPLRPFKGTSWWNTRLGVSPIDGHSAAYIKDAQKRAHSQNYLKLVLGDWGMPSYHADGSDPVYTIHPASGPNKITVHIPAHAKPMRGDDAALSVVDTATNQVVGLTGAKYSNGQWTATGSSRYLLGSAGIEESMRGGTEGNEGHRGIPSSIQSVTAREVRSGAIRHRLEVYWWETASSTPKGPDAYFPMSNSESGKNGIVPEGIVIRIKRSVNLKSKHLSPSALVVATALQKYGAIVGDNSGSGNNLKLQANADWTKLLNQDSLRSIPWRDYRFVRGGYRP